MYIPICPCLSISCYFPGESHHVSFTWTLTMVSSLMFFLPFLSPTIHFPHSNYNTSPRLKPSRLKVMLPGPACIDQARLHSLHSPSLLLFTPGTQQAHFQLQILLEYSVPGSRGLHWPQNQTHPTSPS